MNIGENFEKALKEHQDKALENFKNTPAFKDKKIAIDQAEIFVVLKVADEETGKSADSKPEPILRIINPMSEQPVIRTSGLL
jgi:hypothetical protein